MHQPQILNFHLISLNEIEMILFREKMSYQTEPIIIFGLHPQLQHSWMQSHLHLARLNVFVMFR
jgi:hypothetical protein